MCQKQKNYAAINAWIPGIGTFQMTVGKQHGVKGRARDDLSKLVGATGCIGYSLLCITTL
jgi:hypothetical protein